MKKNIMIVIIVMASVILLVASISVLYKKLPNYSPLNRARGAEQNIEEENDQNGVVSDSNKTDSPIGDFLDSREETGRRSGSQIPNNEQNSERKESGCTLVRPGNIPNVDCDVNFITLQGVSLKISNSIGQAINVKILLNNCDTEKESVIENNEQKDFFFSCAIEDFFEEDITVTYEINENTIQVYGFVSGNVET